MAVEKTDTSTLVLLRESKKRGKKGRMSRCEVAMRRRRKVLAQLNQGVSESAKVETGIRKINTLQTGGSADKQKSVKRLKAHEFSGQAVHCAVGPSARYLRTSGG